MKKDVLSESIWLDVAASLLEGFLGIAVAGGVLLAYLEEREAANEIQLPASGTAVRMKTVLERFPPMNKFLFLCRGSSNGGKMGSRIFCISFQKSNIEM